MVYIICGMEKKLRCRRQGLAVLEKKKKRLARLALLACACLASSLWARVELRWGESFDLPPFDGHPNVGVARPFAGVSNGRVLLAGGANFPIKPLIAGGPKVYHDEVWCCDPSAGTPSWTLCGHLPIAWGEGGYATTPHGIVCVMGAVGADGQVVTNGCFLLSWQGNHPAVRDLPPFPEAAKYAAATARGSKAYAVGTRKVAVLDLAAAHPSWESLPDLPETVSQPACAVQNTSHQRTALFVFAEHGADKRSGGWMLELSPEKGTAWQPVPDVPATAALADRNFVGSLALASGDQHILFFGGTSRAPARERQGKDFAWYLNHPPEWFRLAKEVLVYHTVTERWFTLGETPFQGRVGAAVVALPDGRILLNGGEVGPGTRTPAGAIAAFARTKSWHPLNYVVVVLYLAGMAGMGFWFMRRNRSADAYFKGGGRIPWWVVALSIYATMFSSITFISIPALAYLTDCRYFAISFGIILLAPVVTRYYLPFFRKLNLTSAYEYLEVRFNLACRLFASAAFILFMVARTAIVTYLPAIALSAVVDVDVNVSIVLVTAVTILYCTLGGVEAVIWSDFVQSVILIVGTLAIYAYLVCGTDGGFAGFWSLGQAAEKFRVFDLALDWSKPVFWVVFVGGVVANLASYTSDQCVVQRYMTTKDEKGAAKSILFNGVLSFVNCIVFFTLGVALWTFFRSHPELLDVTMPKNDSVFPLFIGNVLPTGFSGLILAAVAAATMSTLSANLNSAASAFTTDFYARLGGARVTEAGKLRCGRIATVVTGLLGGAFALVLANMEVHSIYDQFQRFLGVLTGGLGCLFFMGVFMKRVTPVGATAGLIVNYAVCFGLDQLSFPHKPHLLLFGALGMVACLIVAPLVSVMTRRSTP